MSSARIGKGLFASVGLDDGRICYGDEVIADSLEGLLEKTVDPDCWIKEDEEE